MKRTKRFLAAFLALAVVFCYMPGMAFADTEVTTAAEAKTFAFADMPNDWSATALSNAAANGLLKGYEETDGLYIKPSGTLSRAEMATVVNRAFGAEKTTALSGVNDVASNSWYAADMSKAVHMGTMKLDTAMRPNDKITRQEACTILARAFKMEATDSSNTALNAFNDKNSIASWAAPSMCALVENGVLSGNNGLLTPTANITRAEFAKIMDNMVKQYINKAGTVTEVAASGNVMVNTAGVTLKNLTIDGDLIVGDGVGSGEITLDSVKVTGKTIVRGGGINSVIITGNSSVGSIVIAKVDGNVRVAVEGNATVSVIVINDGKEDVFVEGKVGTLQVAVENIPVVVQNATITTVNVTAEDANLTVAKGATVTTVTIAQAAKGAKVAVAGTVATLTNAAPKSALSVTGTVKSVEVASTATGTNLEVAKDAKVDKLNASVNMTTSGEGKVTSITGTGTVTANGSSSSSTTTSSGGKSSGGSSSSTNGFAGGEGTASSPWQIATAAQLDRVHSYMNGHFILTANIDLSSYASWTPIGAYVPEADYSANLEKAFTGSLNGGGYTISNLKINRGDLDLAARDMTGTALFGCIAGDASIQNLTIKDVEIFSTGFNTSALVGMAMSSNENAIKGIILSGTNKITGPFYVGGLVGSAQDTNLIDCSAEADVTITLAGGSGAGILGGGIEGGILRDCTVTGTVTATEATETMGVSGIGGLAGCAFESEEVINCKAENVTINVGANAIMIGGLLGYAGVVNEGYFASDPEAFTLIKGCEAVNVTITADSGANRIGGIVGSGFCGPNYNLYYPASSAIHIVNCTASGIIAADNDVIVGSILGYAFRNSAVVSCDGSGITGASNQVGAADAAQAVALADVDSVQSQEAESIGSYTGPSVTEKVTTSGAVFAGGTGTVLDPWQVATKEQLALIQEHLDGHFVLTSDIDLDGYNWAPIGAYVPNDAASKDFSANPDYAFTGSFNGGSCTIYNLTITRDDLNAENMTGTGLFGGIGGDASIQNLIIENATVFSTGSCTGALVGMAMSSNENAIKDITLSGTNKITGSGSVGGLVGSAQDTNIIDCSATADVIMSSVSNGAGILGGGIEGGILSGCYATGTVTATEAMNYGGVTFGVIGVGGLAGCAFDSQEVTNCTVENVTISVGKNAIMVGGLLGYSGVVNEGDYTTDPEGFTLIKGCEVTNVDIQADAGANRIGGIVGSGFCGPNYNSYYPASSAIHIVDCTASGNITADNDVIVGSILGYAFRNSAVVSCDGDGMNGPTDLNQVGAADAAKAVTLADVK
ncbi:S-layer homology domain-containing protein [Clostridium aminobutyricum]|uniref:S-layer homology domain-containing protein n=1 Tax=Clostridium aminobutyricum TaxID=33953 RepID=A0A939IJB1_CLOAM|nr:S-layer homology domain-containing protein [Clostridium aminobutyricum]MBN7773921.1 S-layer homology domain-containing protein [Clostridium aminobutyricum]